MIVGLAHGCWDILHVGHLRHFEEVRGQCDRLVVSVTGDRYVNKGPGRPVFPSAQRAALLRGLRCVDDVFINLNFDATTALDRFRPQIYFKGCDYDPASPTMAMERLFCVEAGIEIRFTKSDKLSSTEALRRLRESANV